MCAPGSREVGTLQATSAAPTAATGAIAKKMLVQLNCSSSQPPTIGPSAIAMPAGRAPEADRAGALAPLGEHVRDQREGGGEDHRGAETHEAAGDDQLAGGVGEASGDAGDSEHAQAGEQKSLAAEAVAEAAAGQQQRREHQAVGVDDPLQLRVRRMQLANQRRERDVDDRDVEVDHKRCQQQRDENQGAALHASCDLHGGLLAVESLTVISQLLQATVVAEERSMISCVTQLIFVRWSRC